MAISVVASQHIKDYLARLNSRTRELHELGNKARALCYDPEDHVDILLADSVPKKVEGLIGASVPKIIGSGVAERIIELEKKYGPGDWRVGLLIAEEVANQKFCKFDEELKAVATGIRVGLAYTTQGVVSAPIEGLAEFKLKKRKDGKDYLSIFFGGPIRGAGGTQQAVSIIIADYVRQKKGIAPYDATEKEIKRYYTEVIDYYERVERKQYKPTETEMKMIITNLGIEINGDPGSDLEVSNYKNLERVETNKIRSGMALILTDGIPLKAEKLWKQLSKWGNEFGLENWNWLEDFIKLKKKTHGGTDKKDGAKITPNYYYISEIVAGRPVFGYPLEKGGFRLRYGRSRLTGDGSWAISPVTMHVLKDYLAIGTQLRVERPGKSTALTSCDYIDGPIVRLKDGTVSRIKTIEKAIKVARDIDEILFLGDLLISHGDFVEHGAKLVPAGYCEEWWVQEMELALDKHQHSLDQTLISNLKQDPIKTPISAQQAIQISTQLKLPLHPHWTFHWNDITHDRFQELQTWFKEQQFTNVPTVKRTLELIGCPHKVSENKITFSQGVTEILSVVLAQPGKGQTGLECINSFLEIKLRDKSGTFIGVRMGRPEKAKLRVLKGSPHVLFPVGQEGGRLRSFNTALDEGKVNAQFPLYLCTKCNKWTVYHRCHICDTKTEQYRLCPICKTKTKKETCHKKTVTYESTSVNITEYMNAVKKRINTRAIPTLIKGVRGTSNKDHCVEQLTKGILRSKHKINVNKDGTIRYDMTELGITHFKPAEVGLSIAKAKELGYKKDIHDKPLTDANQLLEIFPQDIVLPACEDSGEPGADIALKRIANFVDDELELIYKQKPFYKIRTREDLIGHLVIGLSPHTSAGIIGRILGFSKTQGCFAHPYWHDAQRRDLDGEETSIILVMDAFLNFSKQYLPDRRGSRSMDAPLVLSTILNPEEIDDEVYDVDSCWKYPIEFYNATLEYKEPWSIKIEQIRDRIGTPGQYEGIGFTHPVTNMNMGIRTSAYKSIPTMVDKLAGQMELAKQIRAVHLPKVAQLVIEGHFIRDIKGNLRKFTKQSLRCTTCNTIYRRPPLNGRCSKCVKSNLVFTIAEGTIKKYLEPSLELSRYEGVPEYLQQTMQILEKRIDSIFPRDRTKQIGLGGFI